MNTYEQKISDKKDRMISYAQRVRGEGESLSNAGWDALSAIPFGQPILVGHHSERGDRAYRRRATGKIDRGYALTKKADEIARRAEAFGTCGISSDDPDAIDKLQEKLAILERQQEHSIASNKEARKVGQQKPYASYQLTNNGANIRRIEKRIAGLQAKAKMPARPELSGAGWTMCEDITDNRILFTFPGKPSEDMRKVLKSRAFRWSPTRGAWVRQITNNARRATDQIITHLTLNTI